VRVDHAKTTAGTGSLLTPRRREADSNLRSHPTASNFPAAPDATQPVDSGQVAVRWAEASAMLLGWRAGRRSAQAWIILVVGAVINFLGLPAGRIGAGDGRAKKPAAYKALRSHRSHAPVRPSKSHRSHWRHRLVNLALCASHRQPAQSSPPGVLSPACRLCPRARQIVSEHVRRSPAH
jgi:hypothetical protein